MCLEWKNKTKQNQKEHCQSSCKLSLKHQFEIESSVNDRRFQCGACFIILCTADSLQLKLPAKPELERESPLVNKFPQNTPPPTKPQEL